MICRIESVDNTVEIPRRVPRSEARVLLPVPEVPANKTITLTFCYINNEATKKSFMQSGFEYSFWLKQYSRIYLNVATDVVTQRKAWVQSLPITGCGLVCCEM